jgi:hypothetical protein
VVVSVRAVSCAIELEMELQDRADDLGDRNVQSEEILADSWRTMNNLVFEMVVSRKYWRFLE